MQFAIIHQIRGNQDKPWRIRLRSAQPFTASHARTLWQKLEDMPGIDNVRVNQRTGSVLMYAASPASIEAAIELANSQAWLAPPADNLATEDDIEDMVNSHATSEAWVSVIRYFIVRPFLPMFWRMIVSTLSATPFLYKGIKALFRGKLNVSVLDAAALTASISMRDYNTVGMLTMLLGVGDALEEWTRRTSLESLSESLALNVENVWVLDKDGIEHNVPLKTVRPNDRIVARSGNSIPVDGIVVDGEALVNQASMTGEAIPVARTRGGTVFAGTVVESGSIVIKVTEVGEGTRLNQVVSFIEQSEAQKAGIEARYQKLADLAVPFTFALAGIVWLLTGNLRRAAAVLLVDYSCALKLATPLAVLSAMRQGVKRGIAIKGGKYLEAISRANTLVFDKTGTLTSSHPVVVNIIPAPGYTRDEILRDMACLEEHFPHPVARAIVRMAQEKNLLHDEEKHAEVQYVVAHGIASRLHGKETRFGSRHYIEHDEKVNLDIFSEDIARESEQGRSLLFLACDRQPAGMVVIEDPIRPEAAQVIAEMRNLGFSRIIMLTGDDERTAQAVAKKLGITEFRAKVLPINKATIIQDLNRQGLRVMMVGDGINDGPALSAASVGVAMGDGTDLAQAVANVLLVQPDLWGLVVGRRLSRAALWRIHLDFGITLGLNSIYILGAIFMLLTPGQSALLHNLTTIGVALNALRAYLPAGKRQPPQLPEET